MPLGRGAQVEYTKALVSSQRLLEAKSLQVALWRTVAPQPQPLNLRAHSGAHTRIATHMHAGTRSLTD